MKAVILAGGKGTRLGENTRHTNKHLLPVYSKPMIYYPIEMLVASGVTDILIILGGNSVGPMVETLGDGAQFGADITYRFQYKPNGICGALKLARKFVGDERFVVVLGDNLFENPKDTLDKMLSMSIDDLPTAIMCTSPTDKPSSFGVPTFDKLGNISKITEKPKDPESNFAITGLYLYDKYVWSVIDTLKPSARDEFEITDLNNKYIDNGVLKHISTIGWWHDCGDIDALFECGKLVEARENASRK